MIYRIYLANPEKSCKSCLSNSRRLAILAPNTSQRVADLTYSGVRLNTREDARQKILVSLRRLFEPVQRLGGELRIASRTQRAHSFHLRLLQRRIDPQHAYLLFLFDLKMIDANHHLLLRLDCFLITISRLL